MRRGPRRGFGIWLAVNRRIRVIDINLGLAAEDGPELGRYREVYDSRRIRGADPVKVRFLVAEIVDSAQQ
jgi:hypothetical protein